MITPRVLLLVDQLGGGGSERQLVHLLRGAGTRFVPYCHVLNPGGVWEDEARRLSAGLSLSRHRSPVARAAELLRVVRQTCPEVIHSWHSYVCVYPLLTKGLHRRPVVAGLRGDVTAHGETGAPQFRSFYRLLRFADVVVSNSEHALAALRAKGVRMPRASVVRNGIVVPPLRTPRRVAEGPLRVVALGRLSPGKNWGLLIRACAAVVRGGTPISLRIYGEGVERPRLERLCAEERMDPGLALAGFTGDAARVLEDADVLAHSALSEGSPNAVLEGLAAGLPVVVPDLPACRELAAGGDFVQLYPVGDAAACARRIEWLARDPAKRLELGERARAFVERDYACAAMVERYAALYSELAERGSAMRWSGVA